MTAYVVFGKELHRIFPFVLHKRKEALAMRVSK